MIIAASITLIELAEARQEIDRLKAENVRLQRLLLEKSQVEAIPQGVLDSLRCQRDTLTAENARLAAALEKYGDHIDACKYDDGKCYCGWESCESTALSALQRAEKKAVVTSPAV